MTDDTSAVGDVSAFLEAARSRTEKLVEGYFETDSWAKRGGYAQLLIKELSSLLATREEVLRPTLRQVPGGPEHLQRFDESRSSLLNLLAELDDLSLGVGPRDLHQHRPDRVVELIKQLRREIFDYDAYEAHDLVPFLENRLSEQQRQRLGEQATKASKRAPTHPHPGKPPADERSTVGTVLTGLHDRLHDMADHPEEAIETGGEQGP